MGSTPPPSIENVQKKAQKKLPQNFWIWVGPPPPLLENVQKEAAFFGGLFPLLINQLGETNKSLNWVFLCFVS